MGTGDLVGDVRRTDGLELATAQTFASALAGAAEDVTLDLRGLRFIDSAGLRAVLAQRLHFEARREPPG